MPAIKRTFCFDLTPDEQANPLLKVGFAQRVPAIQKPADDSVNDLDRRRRGLVSIIDTLWRKPTDIDACKDWLELRSSNTIVSTTARTFAPKTLKDLPETWGCQLLATYLGVHIEFLEAACDFDQDTWRHIYQHILGAGLSLRIPKAAHNEAVLSKAIIAVSNTNGNRLKGVAAFFLGNKGAGGVDWARLGCFAVVWEDATKKKAKSLLHRPTKTEVAFKPHVVITSDFKVVSNWSDFEATLVCSPSSYICADMFATGTGPHTTPYLRSTSTTFDDVVNRCAREVADAAALASSPVVVTPTAFRAKAKAAQKKANMDKARLALKAKSEQLGVKRVSSV
jgi:hypothetical protein